MKNLQKQIEILEKQMTELQMTHHSLEEIKGISAESSILLPFGPGIYLPGNLKGNDSFVVSVGAGIFVKKNPDQAKEMIDRQMKEIHDIEEELVAGLEKLDSQGVSLAEELTKGQ